MVQLAFNMIFLILLFSIMRKIIYDYLKGRKLKYTSYAIAVNVNIRMYNFDDVQCTVIPSVAYGFVTGMNLQLC